MEKQELPPTMKLYTLQEAAEILKVTPRSIHRFIRDGRLEARKIGRWRISQAAIEKFIQGQPTEDSVL